MATPSSATAPEHPRHDDRADAKRRRGDGRAAGAGAGARIVSLGVQAGVMAAALALFVLFAAAAAVLLLAIVVAAHAFRHRRHRSRYRVPSHDRPPPPSRAAGLSHADLRLLPSFAFPLRCTGGSVSDEESMQPHVCAVCLEPARAGELWRALPACVHAFHAACVDRWLARSPACPVCRTAVAVSAS